MKQGLRYALLAALAAAALSACGAGAGVGVGSHRDSHVGLRGSVDLNNGSSSVTPYGKIGVGVEATR
ncbi:MULTISPECIES: hypothetical protein [Eikenella]|uniref:Lipoprotein n=1 Tax=Eikenella longinqua TaxID=1795827 RepID=A0A1A9RVI8_9NEIS|nr:MULTISPECIES: hypothetical protein [Eikenella]OAM26625.1 hypothetical protein A7P95_07575 [Eikenella longinqua]